MKKVLPALCLFALAISTSCKKDDNNPGSSSGNKSSTLSSGKWKIISSTASYTVAGQQFNNIDIFTPLPGCQKDDLFLFNGDGTCTKDEGASKCSSSAPQTSDAGTWQLLNNENQLKGNVNGFEVTADIVEFSNAGMKLNYTTNISGIATNTTTTYQHVN